MPRFLVVLASFAVLSLGCAPSGPGVCCVRESDPCGRPGGWSRGGWAADEDGCSAFRETGFDGQWQDRVDDHACAIWVDHFGAGGGEPDVCCGLHGGCAARDAGPRPDTGAEIDAGGP